MASHFVLLVSSQKWFFKQKKNNLKNWQCCLKRKSMEGNIFHVLLLACAWSMSVLFLIYTLSMIRLCPKVQHGVILYYIFFCSYVRIIRRSKGKAVPLQATSDPEGSRKLRFPNFMKTVKDDGKVFSPTYGPHLPPENSPGTHFCQKLSRPQGHNVIRRITSMKNSNDTVWDRTSDLPICSAVP
jgi:hypothetical protein